MSDGRALRKTGHTVATLRIITMVNVLIEVRLKIRIEANGRAYTRPLENRPVILMAGSMSKTLMKPRIPSKHSLQR